MSEGRLVVTESKVLSSVMWGGVVEEGVEMGGDEWESGGEGEEVDLVE